MILLVMRNYTRKVRYLLNLQICSICEKRGTRYKGFHCTFFTYFFELLRIGGRCDGKKQGGMTKNDQRHGEKSKRLEEAQLLV